MNKEKIEEHLSQRSDRLQLLPHSGSQSPSRNSQTRSQQLVIPAHLKGASLLAAVSATSIEESKDNYQTIDEFLSGADEDQPASAYENVRDSEVFLRDDYDSVDEAQRSLLVAAREASSKTGKPRSESQTSDNMYVYMERQSWNYEVDKPRSYSDKAGWGYSNLEYPREEEEMDQDGTPLYVNTSHGKPRRATGPAKVMAGTEQSGKYRRLEVMEAMKFPTESSTGTRPAGNSEGRTVVSSGQEPDRSKDRVKSHQSGPLTGLIQNGDGTPVNEEGLPLYINVTREGLEEADEPEELYQNVRSMGIDGD